MAAKQLYSAAKRGDVASVRRCLRAGADVNWAGDFGATPLYVACFQGHLPVVQVLLKHKKASINKARNDGVTPLRAACKNGHLPIVQVLLKHKASIDQAGNFGGTPLYMACQFGHLPIVRVLLKHNASIDQARNDGATPLFIACCNGHENVVRCLLEHNADSTLARQGQTPLQVATRNGHDTIVRLLPAAASSTVRRQPPAAHAGQVCNRSTSEVEADRDRQSRRADEAEEMLRAAVAANDLVSQRAQEAEALRDQHARRADEAEASARTAVADRDQHARRAEEAEASARTAAADCDQHARRADEAEASRDQHTRRADEAETSVRELRASLDQSNARFEEQQRSIADLEDRLATALAHGPLVNEQLRQQVLSRLSIDDFELEEVLGGGSNGMVIRATRNGAPCAVKLCFNLGLTGTNAVRNLYGNEGTILQQLPAHPNIMTLHCGFTARVNEQIFAHLQQHAPGIADLSRQQLRDGTVHWKLCQFFVMDLYPRDLRQVLDQFPVGQPLPRHFCLSVLLDVAQGLLHCQTNGVLHLDIRLENTLMIPDMGSPCGMRAVLGDFGCARRFPSGSFVLTAFPELFQTGLWGNPAHISPELLNARAEERDLDFTMQPVFALGVVGCEVGLGGHPLGDYPLGFGSGDGSNTIHYDRSHVMAVPPEAGGVELQQLLVSMVEFDPARRPSLRSIVTRLEELLQAEF